MKKVLGIVFLLVVLVSAMAYAAEPADQPAWTVSFTADNGAVSLGLAAAQFGTKTGTVVKDGKDNFDGNGMAFTSAAGARFVAFRVSDSTLALNKDYKTTLSPMNSVYPGGQKIWSMYVGAQAGDAGVTPGIIKLYTTVTTTWPTQLPNAVGTMVPVTYTLKMLNNQGLTDPLYANGTTWTITNPATFSLELPFRQLQANTVANVWSDAYQMELVQSAVPEPSSLMAMGAGLMGLIGFAARRRRS